MDAKWIAPALITGASIASLLDGCAQPLKYVTLEGQVANETYMSASGGYNSRYSFSMETSIGLVVIQVNETYKDFNIGIRKESIDALLNPGSMAKVEVMEADAGKQVIDVPADKIHTK